MSFSGRVLLVLSGLAIVAPSAASAQTLYACVKIGNGQLRLLGSEPAPCLPGESGVSWSVQGPKGDPGPAGPQGPAGPRGPAGPAADSSGLSFLAQRVGNLETFNNWMRFDAVVDCTQGQSVNSALQRAAKYASANIGITGVCTEAVQINGNRTSLYGTGPGAGLALPPSSQGPSVVSIGATGVGVTGLTLTGGSTTLSIGNGARASLTDVVISGGGFHGVFVAGAIDMNHVTVKDAAIVGVFAWQGAVVSMMASTITGHPGGGVLLEGGATAQIDRATVISGNQTGITLFNGSSVMLGAATIEQNRDGGIRASGGSAVLLGSTTIAGNVGNGITLQDTSVVSAWGAGTPGTGPQFLTNTGWGVFCSVSPAVAQISGGGGWGGAVFTGNALGSTQCPIGY